MSNYKNPFSKGGKFHNPRIIDTSRVTEPRIMPRWANTYNKEKYDIDMLHIIPQIIQ